MPNTAISTLPKRAVITAGAGMAFPKAAFPCGWSVERPATAHSSEGDKVNERALNALVRAAVAPNALKKKKGPRPGVSIGRLRG